MSGTNENKRKTIESPGFDFEIQRWGCRGNAPLMGPVVQTPSNRKPRSLTCWADQRTRRSRTGCSGRRNRRAPGPEPSTRAVTRQRLGKRRCRSRHVSARWHLALPPDGTHGLSRSVVIVCSAAPVPGSTATRRWRRRRSMRCGYLERCRKTKKY